MERITLYHRGVPVTYHSLSKRSLSIGAHPANDIVLAGGGVAERHLMVFQGSNGKWRARPTSHGGDLAETALDPGTRIALGPFSVEIEPYESAGKPQLGQSESSLRSDELPDFGLVGVSAYMQLLKMEVAQLGRLCAPVLVSGETGTGKELVARGLHKCSKRASGPFVAVNCGGLTSTLLEDTLFGHVRGSFTGAAVARKGVFEQAGGGTLFLDEIGEMPLQQQASLLRVLDENKVRRIGSEELAKVDFRLIVATNRDLALLTEGGAFRLDLYHRIAALRIVTSPLRNRPEDVEGLARHFLDQMASEIGERGLEEEALEKLKADTWPGNARELRNALYRAAALTDRQLLCAGDFNLRSVARKPKRQLFRLDQVPDARLKELLEQHMGNVAAAARELGVPRTSLRDRLKRVS